MKKGGILFTFLFVMLIKFVSAQYVFSLGDFFSSVDSATLILGLLFVIFFAILHKLIFLRMFKGNVAVSVIVSFCISLLSIYGLYTSRWDLGGLFYGLGFSDDLLYIILLIVSLVLFLYLLLKKKLRFLFLGAGLLLIIASLATDFFYEWFTAFVIGVIFLILWFISWRIHKKRSKEAYYGGKGYGTGDFGKDVWKGAKAVGKGAQKAQQWNKRKKMKKALENQIRNLTLDKHNLESNFGLATTISDQKLIKGKIKITEKRIKELKKHLSGI
jgi:hypothetical protein